jgi:hypothetical protein
MPMNAWLLTLRGPAGLLSQFLARPAAIPRARVAETGQKRITAGLTGAPDKIDGA